MQLKAKKSVYLSNT